MYKFGQIYNTVHKSFCRRVKSITTMLSNAPSTMLDCLVILEFLNSLLGLPIRRALCHRCVGLKSRLFSRTQEAVC